MGGGAREDLVLRRLEPPPHRLALRARRERHLLPPPLHARGERRACSLESCLELLTVLLGWQRRAIVDGRPYVAQRPVAGLQGDLLRGGERFDLPCNLLQPLEVVLFE